MFFTFAETSAGSMLKAVALLLLGASVALTQCDEIVYTPGINSATTTMVPLAPPASHSW